MKKVKYIGKYFEDLTTDKIYEVKFLKMGYSEIRLSIIDDNDRERYFTITTDKLFIDATSEARDNVIDEILM